MKARTFTATVAAMSLLATGALLAQDRTAQPRPGQDRETQRPTRPMDRPVMQEREMLHRVDDIHGTNVVNFDGERLGNIDSVVIDTQAGTVKYAVVSAGGFLGIGDRQYAVPWHAFELRPLNTDMFLNMTQEQLKRAPSFERDKWPNWGDRQWQRELDEHFPARRSALRDRRGMDQMPGERRGQTPEDDQYRDTDPTRYLFVLSTDVIGMNVENEQGRKLGTIRDAVMDLEEGHLAFAVISHGGVLGMGRTHVAVPWQALTLRGTDPGDQIMVLDISEERLGEAPEHDNDALPQRRHIEWAKDLFPARDRPFDPRRETPRRDMPERDRDRDRDRD